MFNIEYKSIHLCLIPISGREMVNLSAENDRTSKLVPLAPSVLLVFDRWRHGYKLQKIKELR